MSVENPIASYQTISIGVSHVVRTAAVRDDLIGWVMAGHKRLVALDSGQDELGFRPGEAFLIARQTQWDMVNESAPGGRYEARLIAVAPPLIEKFHQRFTQFTATATIAHCARTRADEQFQTSFVHAFDALAQAQHSPSIREHRVFEVLLLLAERGLVFAPTQELAWADRIRRLLSQRPDADWTLNDVAARFHQSSSSLQRRLARESASFSQCLREIRLERGMALLQDTRLQVSEVAARCGYDSHSRFSAAFRERFGYSPSHLRP